MNFDIKLQSIRIYNFNLKTIFVNMNIQNVYNSNFNFANWKWHNYKLRIIYPYFASDVITNIRIINVDSNKKSWIDRMQNMQEMWKLAKTFLDHLHDPIITNSSIYRTKDNETIDRKKIIFSSNSNTLISVVFLSFFSLFFFFCIYFI